VVWGSHSVFDKFSRLRTLRLIGWQAITEFSKECITLIFWVKQSKENGCSCRHGVRFRGQDDFVLISTKCKQSRTQFIRINWDGEPSGYTEIPYNRILL